MELRPPDQAAMADADIDELAVLLEMRAVPFKGMSLEMLDGFLSALIVAPEVVPIDEWMPLVWGGRPPRWESRTEEQHVQRLLMAVWTDIARRVSVEPERLRDSDTPLIALPESDEAEADAMINYGVEWACGFLDGVELRGDAWGVACQAQSWIDEALIGLEAIAEGIWPAAVGEAAPETLTASERLDLIAVIPHLLHDLNRHRVEQSISRVPIRKEAAPSRNEPCLCGSGRKFKKCCGAQN